MKKLSDMTIRQKLCMIFLLVSFMLVAMAIGLSLRLNQAIARINSVYSSNISSNDLSESLEDMQKYMYEYLNTRSAETLENYYICEQSYTNLIEQLNSDASDNTILLQEKNIRNMSQSYIEAANMTIQAKRGRNVEKYKVDYEACTKLYHYIMDYIAGTNNQHFKENASNYTMLLAELSRLEIFSLAIMVIWSGLSLFFLYMLADNITGPLTKLSQSANEIADGNFDIEFQVSNAKDEIGSVTRAFNSMVVSIRAYIKQIQENMVKEQEMKEKELLMETHLKEAQLKYLQAQINPHFLFNSLNAGAQLAMMEDAESTCLFIEKMAEFFRYNVQKMREDTTLIEEIDAVDNYIYILNVRFSGEIHYSKELCRDISNVRVPSMIIQPLVENAVNHGIRDIEWEGQIKLCVERDNGELIITISDNGKGMEADKIQQIMNGNAGPSADTDSTGVGMYNVKNRLELYYGKKNILRICSDGINQGTKIILTLPENAKEATALSGKEQMGGMENV